MKKCQDLVGKRFDELIVLETFFKEKNTRGYRRRYANCICNCGNIKIIDCHSLTSGRTKNCGLPECNSKDIIGKKFGKLTVIKYKYTRKTVGGTNKYYMECKCDCGKIIDIERNSLITKNTRSCGNCGFYYNGQRLSFIQINLHKLINKGILNYKIGRKSIDIAFTYKGKKIAIEYDCWYWHKNKLDKDRRREHFLINKGWKVLSIKSNIQLPKYEEIWNKIERLVSDSNYEEIILPDWGKI